ncbi:MAG: hypothetical protein AAGA25_04900 [Planctomycetota bacterium]
MNPAIPPSPDAAPPAWRPPTPEALEAHLQRHPAITPSPWARRTPLFVLGGVIFLAVVMQGPAAWLLPWLALMGMILYGRQKLMARRSFERRLARAQELVTLRHHRPALRSAWRLIPELVQHPAQQHRAVAVLAHALDNVGAYDTAIVAYDRLLNDLPSEHPGAIHLKVQRAIASLFTYQLSDADDALRRLRGPVEPLTKTPIGASYRFALLFQSVQTAHYAEAIDESDGLIEALRPLGVEAGYGHALLAWCHAQRNDPERDDANHAQSWWQRATTLLPASALRARFPEIKGEFRGVPRD